MTQLDEQPQGILNRASVALLITLTIPTLLIVGGFFLVAMLGRIPGGDTTLCERTLNDALSVQVERYAYTAGLTPYETQTFSVMKQGEAEWQPVFSDTVQAPDAVSCDENMRILSGDVYLLFNQKSIAISQDSGASWQVHQVCDEPRPNRSGRCDSDPLNIVALNFDASGAGEIVVRESLVDEYGQPLTENDEPIIVDEYTLRTLDAGLTWEVTGIE